MFESELAHYRHLHAICQSTHPKVSSYTTHTHYVGEPISALFLSGAFVLLLSGLMVGVSAYMAEFVAFRCKRNVENREMCDSVEANFKRGFTVTSM